MLSAINDLGLFVCKFGQLAEDAAIRLPFVFAGGRDVGIAPGRPEVIHDRAAYQIAVSDEQGDL